MGQKKTTLISYLVQLLMAAVVVFAIYSALTPRLNVATSPHRVYADLPNAWLVRCWSDAMFIPAVLWLGMGGMLWIATTDFFDIFRYAFSSLLVLFSPLKDPRDHKHYYEYKQERAEKRKGKTIPVTVLVIGVVLMLGALTTSFVHEGMVGPWYEAHDEEINAMFAEAAAQAAEEEAEELEEDEDFTDEAESDDENPTDETTGGETHE